MILATFSFQQKLLTNNASINIRKNSFRTNTWVSKSFEGNKLPSCAHWTNGTLTTTSKEVLPSQRLTIDNLVSDQTLEKNTYQSDESILHVFVLQKQLIIYGHQILRVILKALKDTVRKVDNVSCRFLHTLRFSHEDMQLEIYMCTNSVGKSTAVVRRFTTSIEWRLMSIFTSTFR